MTTPLEAQPTPLDWSPNSTSTVPPPTSPSGPSAPTVLPSLPTQVRFDLDRPTLYDDGISDSSAILRRRELRREEELHRDEDERFRAATTDPDDGDGGQRRPPAERNSRPYLGNAFGGFSHDSERRATREGRNEAERWGPQEEGYRRGSLFPPALARRSGQTNQSVLPYSRRLEQSGMTDEFSYILDSSKSAFDTLALVATFLAAVDGTLLSFLSSAVSSSPPSTTLTSSLTSTSLSLIFTLLLAGVSAIFSIICSVEKAQAAASSRNLVHTRRPFFMEEETPLLPSSGPNKSISIDTEIVALTRVDRTLWILATGLGLSFALTVASVLLYLWASQGPEVRISITVIGSIAVLFGVLVVLHVVFDTHLTWTQAAEFKASMGELPQFRSLQSAYFQSPQGVPYSSPYTAHTQARYSSRSSPYNMFPPPPHQSGDEYRESRRRSPPLFTL